MDNFVVRKVAVLGAGVMGAQIAAHCVNAKVPVVLFDLPDAKGPNKNGIVLRAIENLKKLNPAPLGNKDDAIYIEPANYEENLELLRGCDGRESRDPARTRSYRGHLRFLLRGCVSGRPLTQSQEHRRERAD